jgi:hypothetical protein
LRRSGAAAAFSAPRAARAAGGSDIGGVGAPAKIRSGSQLTRSAKRARLTSLLP